MMGLDQTATIYAENVTTGAYTDVVRAGLPCRLAHVNRQAGATAAERAELAAIRNMLWEPSYVMPETAQVEVDSVRWQVVSGTFGALRGPTSAVVYRRCDLVRVV